MTGLELRDYEWKSNRDGSFRSEAPKMRGKNIECNVSVNLALFVPTCLLLSFE